MILRWHKLQKKLSFHDNTIVLLALRIQIALRRTPTFNLMYVDTASFYFASYSKIGHVHATYNESARHIHDNLKNAYDATLHMFTYVDGLLYSPYRRTARARTTTGCRRSAPRVVARAPSSAPSAASSSSSTSCDRDKSATRRTNRECNHRPADVVTSHCTCVAVKQL